MSIIRKTGKSFKNLFNGLAHNAGEFHRNMRAAIGSRSRLTSAGKLKNHLKMGVGILTAATSGVLLANGVVDDFQSAATAVGGALSGLIIALDGMDNMIGAGKNARSHAGSEKDTSDDDFENLDDITDYRAAIS